MDAQELINKVRKLEIKSRYLTRDLFSGDYHSAFKGRGMSFADVRTYQYGDDIRNIDWNVTARTNEPHVKEFEEERELTVMLLVDVSGSVFAAENQVTKHQFMAELVAVMAFSAVSNHDKVGLILFSDEVKSFIPPKSGRNHILRIIREVLQYPMNSDKTQLASGLKHLVRVQKKSCIAFLLSDFVTADEQYLTPLSIAAKYHDLIGLYIRNNADRTQLPDSSFMVRTRDIESRHQQIIDSHCFADTWTTRFDPGEERARQLFNRLGKDFLSIPMTDEYVTLFHRFFKQRALRR